MSLCLPVNLYRARYKAVPAAGGGTARLELSDEGAHLPYHIEHIPAAVGRRDDPGSPADFAARSAEKRFQALALLGPPPLQCVRLVCRTSNEPSAPVWSA